MGHLVYFLILAIVSITGRVAASSHNARRRRPGLGVPGVSSEKIELESLDEKQVLRDDFSIVRSTSPSLPVFRVRRTLLGSVTDGVGVLDEKHSGKEDLVVRRRELKKTLRIVIPGGEISRRDSSSSDVPPSFDLYAEQCVIGQRATSYVPLATARKAPRIRFSSVQNGKRLSYTGSKVLSVHGTTNTNGRGGHAFAPSDPMSSTNTDTFRVTPRPHSINRVGMLKLVEKARELADAPDLGTVSG